MENADDKLVRTLESLEDISSYLEKIEEVESSFDSRLDGISDRIDATFDRSKEVSSNLSKLEGSINKLEDLLSKLSVLNEKLSSLLDRLDKVDAKAIVSECDKASDSITSLIQEMKSIKMDKKKKGSKSKK